MTACLVSDPSSAPALDDDSAEETESEMESENEDQESSNTVDDEEDSMPKKLLHLQEQKMVRRNCE